MILQGDSAEILKDFNDNCIDLTVTSPPYDNLRTYGGYTFNFEATAKQLYRVTKEGGITVWVIGDATAEGDESGSSFRQALVFKETGFRLHDTMIYSKGAPRYPDAVRYPNVFEFMFIFSKGKPKTFNQIKDVRVKYAGQIQEAGNREKDGKVNLKQFRYSQFKSRTNIWEYYNGFNVQTRDAISFQHPATFPEALAADHIKSWSNEGDLILDPFAGSGTTLKAAHQLGRKWVGIEINPDYVQLAKKRLTPYIEQQRLEQFIT